MTTQKWFRFRLTRSALSSARTRSIMVASLMRTLGKGQHTTPPLVDALRGETQAMLIEVQRSLDVSDVQYDVIQAEMCIMSASVD